MEIRWKCIRNVLEMCWKCIRNLLEIGEGNKMKGDFKHEYKKKKNKGETVILSCDAISDLPDAFTKSKDGVMSEIVSVERLE